MGRILSVAYDRIIMGNFISWFERTYKGIIIVLVAIMAITLVVLALQQVNASKPAAGAEAGPIPTFTSAPVQAEPRAVFFGDSYVEGVGASTPAKRWTSLVAKHEGWTEINLGQGGTGYVNGGPDQGQADRYDTRLAKITAAAPDVIVVNGGQNDLLFPTDEVTPVIASTIEKIHNTAPDAALVIVGPVNPGDIKQGTRDFDAAARAAAEQVDATYVSSISPTSTYKAPDDYWTDGQHPSDSGHEHIAARVEGALPPELKSSVATSD